MEIRFSIRTALFALSLAAGFSWILAQSLQGAAWAIGVSAAVASLLLLLIVHACWYLVVRLGGSLLGLGHQLDSSDSKQPPRPQP